jgi:hypothetical protein
MFILSEKDKAALRILFYKGTNTIYEDFILMTYKSFSPPHSLHQKKSHSSKTIISRVRILT